MPPAAARSPVPHARIATARQRAAWLLLGLMALSVLLAGLGASVGSTGFDSVLRMHGDPVAWQIVWDIRLPRTLGAWLAGALLGLSGAVAQGLFRNPLADPYLLGSASGAALGGAVAMAMFGVSPVAAQWLARIGITGFCWGGRITWLYAAHQARIKAGVAWYGRLEGKTSDITPRQPADVAAELKAPVLGLYGGKDTGIPLDTVERLQATLAREAPGSEIHVYPGAPHAFFADYRPSYHRAEALDGWARLLAWFQRHGVAP